MPDAQDPVLGPATRLLWRGPDEIHLELGANGVVVEGLPEPVLGHIAGRHTTGPQPRLDHTARLALTALTEGGYLWPSVPAESATDPRLHAPLPRLAGDLRSLAVRHGQRAAELLAARRYSCVEIHGSSRVAVHLAAVLAAAGVGRVRCTATGSVHLSHTAPGGLAPEDEGAVRVAAADRAVRRAAPEVDATPLAEGERPDLTVIAEDSPVPPERRDSLHAAGAPYLCLMLSLDRGVVGPLVLPGLTSCVRCADLVRRDRDPAWTALAVQLATPPRYGPASDVAVAAVVAGVAALQALAFLDGEDPATIDGTLEISPPDWRLRRRSWPVHPECNCTEHGPDPTRG